MTIFDVEELDYLGMYRAIEIKIIVPPSKSVDSH